LKKLLILPVLLAFIVYLNLLSCKKTGSPAANRYSFTLTVNGVTDSGYSKDDGITGNYYNDGITSRAWPYAVCYITTQPQYINGSLVLAYYFVFSDLNKPGTSLDFDMTSISVGEFHPKLTLAEVNGQGGDMVDAVINIGFNGQGLINGSFTGTGTEMTTGVPITFSGSFHNMVIQRY
jgi:hypothetical protein